MYGFIGCLFIIHLQPPKNPGPCWEWLCCGVRVVTVLLLIISSVGRNFTLLQASWILHLNLCNFHLLILHRGEFLSFAGHAASLLYFTRLYCLEKCSSQAKNGSRRDQTGYVSVFLLMFTTSMSTTSFKYFSSD